jgi:hypothetical protein
MREGFDSRGKFAAGNKLAPGNPLNRKAQHLCMALFRAVDKGDIEEVVHAFVDDLQPLFSV